MKNTQQQQAKDLYFGSNSTQKEIADTVGVTEKTIYRWIKQEDWDNLRKATLAAPAVVVNHLYSQVVELQNNIAAREEGNRFPTMQEAEITRKLINNITKLGMANSSSTTMQVMMSFSTYMMKADPDFTKKLVKYATTYMYETPYANGYPPYHFLHDVKHPMHPGLEADPLVTESVKDNEEAPASGNKFKISVEASVAPAPSKMSADTLIPQPDISNTPSSETLSSKASANNTTSGKSSPQPDISRHSQAVEEHNIPAEYKGVFPAVPLLPGGIKWLGRGMVYDPALERKREIRFGEIDQLRKMGFDRRKLDY